MATQTPSKACCTVPPVQTEGYKAQGKYIDLDGTKCYVTGSPEATSAVFVIYDIFGYYEQTLQGADILAHAADGKGYQVYIPDFFLGKPYLLKDFPPDTDAKKEKLNAFFGGPASPSDTVDKIPGLLKSIAATSAGKGITKWAGLGLCWGGKIISLSSQKGTAWTAAAEVHPAMVDPADANGIDIPVCILASKDEDAEAVKKFESNLSGAKHVETFGDQVHGWMGARADFADERCKSEYRRGYQTVLTFFQKYL